MIIEEAGLPNETEEQYFRRINIGHLHHTFNLILKYGRGTMLKYCREKSFSVDDIDRVEQKFNRAYGKDKPELTGDVPF